MNLKDADIINPALIVPDEFFLEDLAVLYENSRHIETKFGIMIPVVDELAWRYRELKTRDERRRSKS